MAFGPLIYFCNIFIGYYELLINLHVNQWKFLIKYYEKLSLSFISIHSLLEN